MKTGFRFAAERVSMVLAALAIAVLDQIIKGMVESYPFGYVIHRFEPFFEIVYTVNKGAAFSILSGRSVFLLAVTSLVLLLLVFMIMFYRYMSRSAAWCIAVLLGGGAGNWVDRFFSGGVTDYIRILFLRFPVFNLADICITVSVFGLFILLLFDRFYADIGEKHGTAD